MKRLIAFFVSAILLAGPLSAQDDDDGKFDRFLDPELQVGTRFMREAETAGESDARKMQKRLARCIFFRNKDHVRKLLANSDFDRINFDALPFDERNFYDEIDFAKCISSATTASSFKLRVSMQYSTLRNLLAEEVYVKDNADAPVLEEGAPTKVPGRVTFGRSSPRAEVLAEVSDCISYRNGAVAHEFLSSKPGTSPELDAIEKLWPTLLTCLETENPPELSISMIRQMVADGMWARSHFDAWSAADVADVADDASEASL